MNEMTLVNFILYLLFLNYVKAAYLDDEFDHKSNPDAQAMTNFANLLRSIVKVNEERVDAIRKIASLQDYMLTKNRIKLDDYYDSLETSESGAAPIEVSGLRVAPRGNVLKVTNYKPIKHNFRKRSRH